MDNIKKVIAMVVFVIISIGCGLLIGEALTTTDIVVDNYPVDGF